MSSSYPISCLKIFKKNLYCPVLRSHFHPVMSMHLVLSPWVRCWHQVTPQPLCAPSAAQTEPRCLCCSLCLQSSEQFRVSWEHGAARYSVESHRLLPFPPLSSFVWLCSSRGSHGEEEGERRGGRELQILSSLPSSPAVFLWLFVIPPPLHSLPEATAPWCTQIPLGWICLWCAYHKVCHHLGEWDAGLLLLSKPSK